MDFVGLKWKGYQSERKTFVNGCRTLITKFVNQSKVVILRVVLTRKQLRNLLAKKPHCRSLSELLYKTVWDRWFVEAFLYSSVAAPKSVSFGNLFQWMKFSYFTLSVLNFVSLSSRIVSMRNSLLSCIIWISDSHWALTSRSNSKHDSCVREMKTAIKIYTQVKLFFLVFASFNFSYSPPTSYEALCCRAKTWAKIKVFLETWMNKLNAENFFFFEKKFSNYAAWLEEKVCAVG